MVDISSVSAIVAATSVVAGVIYYSFQIRNQTRARQTDLILRLYATFDSKEFLKPWVGVLKRDAKDFDDYEKKYSWLEALEVGMFFEGIGVLLKRKLINIDLVDDLFTGPIKMTWEKMEYLTKKARKQREAPTIFEWFEYLYNEMKKREQQLAKVQ